MGIKNTLATLLVGTGLVLAPGCGKKPTQPPVQELKQEFRLVNKADYYYRLDLGDYDSALRRVFYNGTQVDSLDRQVTESPYEERGTGIPKGEYISIAEQDTAKLSVPNYMPEVKSQYWGYFNSAEQIEHGYEIEFPLPTSGWFIDHNPEDNPVPLNGFDKTNSNIEYRIENGKLFVKGLNVGNSGLEFRVGSEEGGTSNLVMLFKVVPFLDRIAFWSNRTPPEGGYNEDIYVGDFVNGSLINVKRLTTHPWQEIEPTFSYDGKELLFGRVSDVSLRFAIWRMNLDGSNQRDISSHLVEIARQAHWGSDEKIVVAYRDNNDTEAGIGIIDLIADTFTPIYSEPNSPYRPRWPRFSLDGSVIAFEKYFNNWEICAIDLNNGNLENLTNDSADDSLPTWSPEGDLFFKSYRFGSADIFRMGRNGGNVVRITDNPGVESYPAVSPDGAYLIFVHDITSFSSPQLYFMNSDGTGNWTQLTLGGAEGANVYPAFRPKPK
jgi:TolB protein